MHSEDPSTTAAVIALLSELVAFATISETSNAQLQGWLAQHIEERGGTVRMAEGAPGRYNLLATIGPDRPGGVLLAGHTDVVPPGPGWAHDPWSAHHTDGRVSGRGTADMKGFLAAVLVALTGVDPRSLRAPVRLLASYDEEIGCIGVHRVLPEIAADPRVAPELVVVGEPTGMHPRLSHLGKETFRVEVRAASAHSSRAATHPSAITEAAALVSALADIQRTCPGPTGDAPPYSLNVGAIAGGTQANVIAESCTFDFEVRFDVAHSADRLLGPFHDAVDVARARLAAVGGDVTVERTNGYPALQADPAHPAFHAAVQLADRGPAVPLGFGTEAGLIAEALGSSVVICGPGDIAVAHRPDEFVPVDELDRCAVFVRQLVDHFCR